MSSKKIVRVREVMRNNFFETDGLAKVTDVLLKMRDENIEVVIIKKRDPNDEYGVGYVKRRSVRSKSPPLSEVLLSNDFGGLQPPRVNPQHERLQV